MAEAAGATKDITATTTENNEDEVEKVSDKEERKMQRRQKADNKINPIEVVVQDDSGDKERNRSGARQIADSVVHLDRRKYIGIQDVTSIRVATDEAESKRRDADENIRRERLHKLQGEALSSAKANAAIEMKWAELLDMDIPQALHHEIQSQMQSCRTAIQAKDDLIGDFQKQLRSKDEEYVRTLRQQGEDVETLLQKIRKEYRELYSEYNNEFHSIEDAFVEERDRLIQEHTSDIDSLFEQRKNRETAYKEQKQKREETYQKEIDALIAKGTDQHTKLKIELEMNIQTLKEQLEEIRATYQLNTEKLDYNYRVLTDLDVEKHAELNKYKKRLTKLKDQLSGYITKYTELESTESKVNDDLTEDYRRLTRKYKDLQTKFRHFEISDTQKFEEVWGMHEDEAKNKVDQLLKADKIITEQQMNWVWKAPDMAALQSVLNKRGAISEPSAVTEANAPGEEKKTVSAAKMRAVMRLISSEGGFLINPEVQAAIDALPEEEAELSKAENLLKALGVKSEDKLKSLIAYFFHDRSGSQTQESQEEFEMEIQTLHGAPDDIFELRDLIRAEDVIQAISMFIEDTSDSNPAAGATAGKDPLGGKRKQQAMKLYWDQLSQVVSDESVSVWKQLEKDSQNLKEVLTRRSGLCSEVDMLAKRNAELKTTLNRYLGGADNRYFQVPPGQTIRVKKQLSAAAAATGKPVRAISKKAALANTGKKPKGNDDAKLMSKTR